MPDRHQMKEFFLRNRTKIGTGGLAILVVTAVAFGAMSLIHASDEAQEATHKVKVIEHNNNNCLPKKGEKLPRRPALCKAGFDKAVQLISPDQACQIVAKGSSRIVVNGQRIGSVRCAKPAGSSESSDTSNEATPKTTSPRDGNSELGTEPTSMAPSHPHHHHHSQPKPPSSGTQPAPTSTPPTQQPPAEDTHDKGNHGEATGNEGPKGNGPEGQGPPGQAAQGIVEGVTDAAGEAIGTVFDTTCTLLQRAVNLCHGN